jgi:hypothetical protein
MMKFLVQVSALMVIALPAVRSAAVSCCLSGLASPRGNREKHSLVSVSVHSSQRHSLSVHFNPVQEAGYIWSVISPRGNGISYFIYSHIVLSLYLSRFSNRPLSWIGCGNRIRHLL